MLQQPLVIGMLLLQDPADLVDRPQAAVMILSSQDLYQGPREAGSANIRWPVLHDEAIAFGKVSDTRIVVKALPESLIRIIFFTLVVIPQHPCNSLLQHFRPQVEDLLI